MKKITILFVTAYLVSFVFSNRLLSAETGLGNAALDQPTTSEKQESRYVLLMVRGRSTQNTRVPALILDSVRGIVWTCRDLQDDRPAWIKTDLAQNAQEPSSRKYIASILEWQEATNLKVPAIILDKEEGATWTCSDIVLHGDTWIETDFKDDSQKEIRGAEQIRGAGGGY